MFVTPKKRSRIEKQLGSLRRENGRGSCWICGSGSGVKTCREGYGTRCKRCIERERTSEAVELYEKLANLIRSRSE